MIAACIHGAALPVSQLVNVSVDLSEISAGTRGTTQWHVPEEVPVAFVYNQRNYAVMMATPDDVVDFALGFSLTERVVKTPGDILSLDV